MREYGKEWNNVAGDKQRRFLLRQQQKQWNLAVLVVLRSDNNKISPYGSYSLSLTLVRSLFILLYYPQELKAHWNDKSWKNKTKATI